MNPNQAAPYNPPRLTEAELSALAAMANVEAVQMQGDNALRLLANEAPAWRSGCGYMQAGTKLYDELYRRGVLS